MSEYTPIDCNFYDVIEHYAIRRQVIPIRFLDEDETEKSVNSRILDTMVRSGEEFVKLEEVPELIRMDRIISLNGELNPGSSCTV